ncbi:hypothetical protein [Cyanobium sp. A2C-AMD]|uniref:hypothetical protein n=1 Tax=Cyanobium sp. A2C-AMD TaxID=2823695 RepID=UPI0020CD4CA9|nr:hypothetical protein [Cyanobium sp. A2C-AMD]MCP9876026.1 hypothetical protein [Cyanobium sp. A2C-AMD]
MLVSELGLLVKAQNKRIHQTTRELSSSDSTELRDDLRRQVLARDVLLEILSTYLDFFDAHDCTNENHGH